MNEADVYGVLGLDPGADGEEVKAAFRYLSKKYHPDRSGDPRTSGRFARVVKAYKLLNQESRKERLLRNPIKERFRASTVEDDLFSLGSIAVASSDPELRRYAVRKLGFTGKKTAYVFLRRALSDASRGVVEAAIRSIADLSLFQASGEIAALYARSDAPIRRAILDSAETTGEPLFRPALEYAAGAGGLEGLRARRLLADASAQSRAGA